MRSLAGATFVAPTDELLESCSAGKEVQAEPLPAKRQTGVIGFGHFVLLLTLAVVVAQTGFSEVWKS